MFLEVQNTLIGFLISTWQSIWGKTDFDDAQSVTFPIKTMSVELLNDT